MSKFNRPTRAMSTLCVGIIPQMWIQLALTLILSQRERKQTQIAHHSLVLSLGERRTPLSGASEGKEVGLGQAGEDKSVRL